MVGGAAGADVTAALTATQDKREALRAALEGNAAIMAELQAQGISLDTVVAVDVGASGEVLIFTQA
jgi:prophage DNA circulation protein